MECIAYVFFYTEVGMRGLYRGVGLAYIFEMKKNNYLLCLIECNGPLLKELYSFNF